MNYRHQYHAGNFADVWKHTLLLALVRGLQRKEKGFLYLDSHAGRGTYDLMRAAQGDTLERTPEWPEGIGRIEQEQREAMPSPVRDYLERVERFRSERQPTVAASGSAAKMAARLYPGSPWLVRALLRPQDRMALYESHPEEGAELQAEFAHVPRVRVELSDGYVALRACLPPPERRALVLMDPPFEALDEFAQISAGLEEGLRRAPAATFAIWYPLTQRAEPERFLQRWRDPKGPPAWTAELAVVGEAQPIKMKGCGLMVVNPPWQQDQQLEPTLNWLCRALAQSPEARSELRWLVPE